MNEKELAIQIEFLLNHSEKREKIIEKGYEFVQKFNDKHIAESYMNLYEILQQ